MKKVVIFGASGGLASFLINDFVLENCLVDGITRSKKVCEEKYDLILKKSHRHLNIKEVNENYSEFEFQKDYDILILPQSVFEPNELINKNDSEIENEIKVGLTEIIKITRNFLNKFPPKNNGSKNIAIIGSTSAYSGFKKTTTYCAIKHGLLGFVRSLNSEYENTNYRFFLFSMGTMKTEMSKKIIDQDPDTFLEPSYVSKKIVNSLLDSTNLFEPEVLIKRRLIRYI